MIQGGYVLGSASQSYSHTTRASPATVSAGLRPHVVGSPVGRWSPATISGTWVAWHQSTWMEMACVASDKLPSLSGPQLISTKLIAQCLKPCCLL